jgi:glutamyl-tRNA synthetase
MRPFLGPTAARADDDTLTAIAGLLQERLRTLAEAQDQSEYFFTDDLDYDPALLLQRGMSREQALEGLTRAASVAEQVEPFTPGGLEAAFDALTQELGLRRVQLFMSIRVACTGREASPPLFETMVVLGRSRTLSRLREAATRLRRHSF